MHKKPKRHVDEKAADPLNDSGSKPQYYTEEIGTKKYPGDIIRAIIGIKEDCTCMWDFSSHHLLLAGKSNYTLEYCK